MNHENAAEIALAQAVGCSHLQKAREAIDSGKTEIAETHLRRARDAFTDALIDMYPWDAWNSGDFITIKQERERRKRPPQFVVAED